MELIIAKIAILKKLIALLTLSASLAGSPLGGITPIFDMGSQIVPLAYTDDNVGEDLIIHSDLSTYLGIRSVPVYFSIENTSVKNQNVKIAFSKSEGNVEFIQRYITTTTTIEPLNVSSSTVIEHDGFIDTGLKEFSSTSINRKDIKGTQTLSESNDYFIKSGDTAFFYARL